MRTREQPVTSSVIRWAINESGYTPEELDSKIEEGLGTVRTWARGDERPNWTQVQKLASALKRPVAIFYLPEPPAPDTLSVSFRAPPKALRKKPNPVELRYVREARRLQR